MPRTGIKRYYWFYFNLRIPSSLPDLSISCIRQLLKDSGVCSAVTEARNIIAETSCWVYTMRLLRGIKLLLSTQSNCQTLYLLPLEHDCQAWGLTVVLSLITNCVSKLLFTAMFVGFIGIEVDGKCIHCVTQTYIRIRTT